MPQIPQPPFPQVTAANAAAVLGRRRRAQTPSLKDKTVLIIGRGSGIARAIV